MREIGKILARRQITQKPEMANDDDLPELTPQQMDFVRHLLDGKTASDAYRAAYSAENMVANSIWCEASKLRHNSNVAQWLAAARTANLGSAKVTLEGHVAELERLREIALSTGNIGAAVQAEQLRGKAAGHYVEQVRDVTDKDPMEMLDRLALEIGPEAVRKLAEDEGIAWGTQHRWPSASEPPRCSCCRA
jgi:hypothetical protein